MSAAPEAPEVPLPPAAIAAALVLLFCLALLLALALDNAQRRHARAVAPLAIATETTVPPAVSVPPAPEHHAVPNAIPSVESEARPRPEGECRGNSAVPPAERADLLRDLAALNVVLSAPGARLILGEDQLEFASGQAQPARFDAERLAQLATVLARHPTLGVRLAGHTDTVGDAADNVQLSEARAAAVGALLVGLGVPAVRLSIVGYGAAQPLADNDTAAGRARNRRVELYLTWPDERR